MDGEAAGAAYLYRAGAAELPNWELQGRYFAPDAADGMRFSFSVALQVNPSVDSRLFIGAQQANSRRGALYELRGPVPAHFARLAPNELTVGDVFGTAVALWGNDVVVGAPGVDIEVFPDRADSAGAAYFFGRERTVFRNGFE